MEIRSWLTFSQRMTSKSGVFLDQAFSFHIFKGRFLHHRESDLSKPFQFISFISYHRVMVGLLGGVEETGRRAKGVSHRSEVDITKER
jgi:hypothetical protein